MPFLTHALPDSPMCGVKHADQHQPGQSARILLILGTGQHQGLSCAATRGAHPSVQASPEEGMARKCSLRERTAEHGRLPEDPEGAHSPSSRGFRGAPPADAEVAAV